MRSTEIELEKLNKLWATLQTTTMAIDSLTKRAIHDAERKQRRLDDIQGQGVSLKDLDDTQQIVNLGAKLVASQNKHDQLQAQYSDLQRTSDQLSTSYAKLLDLYNNLQAEVKTLRNAPKPINNDSLLKNIIGLVSAYSINTITPENLHWNLSTLLSRGSTSEQLVAKLKSIL